MQNRPKFSQGTNVACKMQVMLPIPPATLRQIPPSVDRHLSPLKRIYRFVH